MFPVEVAHLSEPTPDYVRTAAQVTWKIHKQVSVPHPFKTYVSMCI